MAGQGAAPKPPEQRRNRVAPRRGDWIDLPRESGVKPPAMPAAPKAGWAVGTKLAWKAWWADPASLVWSPADRESLRAVAYLHHELEVGKLSVAGEVRLRLDGLGLTQKGKRDLRLRVVLDETAEKRDAAPVPADDRRSRLKVV